MTVVKTFGVKCKTNQKLETGILWSEFKEDSIRDWREAGEKGENGEGELIRDSDSFKERECTQDKSVELFSAVKLWLGRLVKQLPLGEEKWGLTDKLNLSLLLGLDFIF